jgi:prepilin-type N-terminal cleavage/methylation domain-containing protein
MRKALTLIELILSMVIIGIVFTVIPRLIISMNQSAQVTIKEEAMYNAMAQMGMILNLPWDNNNTQNSQILTVFPASGYDCNTSSGYRIGGFIGGRNCIASPGISFNAGSIGKEDGWSNDIDDFNNTDVNATKNCSSGAKGLYTINTAVHYVDDPALIGTALLSKSTAPNQSNTKRIAVQVGYGSDSQHTGCITALQYHSFNIGNVQINDSQKIGGWQ